jgi:pyrroloquinoline quinone (PQQ) biosynthesis protein C
MSFFDDLQQQTENARQVLQNAPIIVQCLQGDITLDQYVAFLTQAYHHVRHTVPLLMAAGSRMPEEKAWLRKALAEYIEEELGHEEWILNDIAACGVDKEMVRYSDPNMATELMIAYAYDTIQRKNPVGFFGMVQVLEGTSINLACQAADFIQKKLGLPDKAFTYLRSHGILDLEHVDFFKSLMNRLDSDTDKKAVVHCSRQFYKLYGDIFRSLTSTEFSEMAA